jgi:hypothetical protein
MMNENLTSVLEARQKTHGDFSDHARITQGLKDVAAIELYKRAERNQPALTAEQREAIDMILHKIGRIIAGDPNEPDHWVDIAGYAQIAQQRKEV